MWRRPTILVALLAAVILAATGATTAFAAPEDPDGTSPGALREQLDIAARAYNDAKGRLDVSRGRQSELERTLSGAELRLKDLDIEVGFVAAAAYRGNRLNMTSALLDSGSPSALLHGAATVEYLALRDDREIRELLAVRRTYTTQKAALIAEVALQEKQLAEMEKRKKDAERALGNNSRPGGGIEVPPGSATPAKRNPDGSWPSESCSAKDPTTAGCLTPRTLNALQQSRAANFARFTACFRGGGDGEHPKGRACDHAAFPKGFTNARAFGADKVYGDRLAAWFIGNADRLGVLYVIWYKQIWFPGLGWRPYGGDGTPAGDHYNHVHLSMH